MEIGTRDLEILHDPDRVAALMHPERRRLVGALVERPDSATGLARRLDDSRQRLNYHLKLLEEAGLVELARERPRRGVTERVLRPVAERFVVDSGVLGALAPEGPRESDRFSATYLVSLAARAIRELARLLARAASSGKRLPTAGLSGEVRLARPRDFDAFVEDLGRAVADVVRRHHTEAGETRPFRVLSGVYPAPAADPARDTDDETTQEDEEEEER